MLDTRRAIATPEGVELNLRVTGPPTRMLAWILDTIIRGFIYFVAAMAFALLGRGGTGLLYILFFFVEWFYPVFFEVRYEGATPGKKVVGIQVLHDDGTPVGFASSVLRNLLRFADFLPFFYGFGLLCMMLQRDFKRLGDLAAGTVVVHRYKEGEHAEIEAIDSLAPPRRLLADEQRLVVEFAERLPTWTHQRGVELATLAKTLTEATGSESRQRLVAIANHLVGRR